MCAMNPRLLVPRASGFNPRSIADLALWLEAGDYNASTGTWTDRSGNGRNFSQDAAGNDQPTKTLTINERSVVSFDGDNDFLAGPQVSFTQWSAFAVVRPDRTTGDNGIFTADNAVGTRGPQFLRWSGTAYQIVGFQATNSARVESPSVAAVIGTTVVVSAVQGASTLEMWHNNTSNGTTSCTQQAYTSEMALGAGTYNTTPSASGFADGDIGEILLYSRALTTTERQRVQTYLARKFGVTLS